MVDENGQPIVQGYESEQENNNVTSGASPDGELTEE